VSDELILVALLLLRTEMQVCLISFSIVVPHSVRKAKRVFSGRSPKKLIPAHECSRIRTSFFQRSSKLGFIDILRMSLGEVKMKTLTNFAVVVIPLATLLAGCAADNDDQKDHHCPSYSGGSGGGVHGFFGGWGYGESEGGVSRGGFGGEGGHGGGE
jgi:hypothetical protein